MDSYISNDQKHVLFTMLDEAMEILRDDKPFIKEKSPFGMVKKVDSSTDDSGGQYLYKLSSIPSASIAFVTVSDPIIDSNDRSHIPAVPQSLRIMFRHLVYGLDRTELERRLSLEAYWIDSDGVKHEGNSLQPLPPAVQFHVYRYRAKQRSGSLFPVDVELSFFDPRSEDVNKEPVLDAITIERAYPGITREMRTRKREEQNK